MRSKRRQIEEMEEEIMTPNEEDALLPSEIRELNENTEEAEKKPNPFIRFIRWIRSWKIWVKVVTLVVIFALVTVGVMAATTINTVIDVVDEMNKDTEIDEDYDLGLTPVDGFINLLLLGVDARDMSDLKDARSDMVMVASINVETYEVTLTSIYRDTYIKLGDSSTYDKIAHAFFYGGAPMSMKTVNQAMDLNIENYVLVNWKVVVDVIDAVGGIELDVQQNEIKEMNLCTYETAYWTGHKDDYATVSAPGVQTVSGVQAVGYGRMRNGVGDDFKRTERMRIVCDKLLEKMKTCSFSKLKELINIMAPQVKTTLKFNDLLALAKDVNKYSVIAGSGFPYNVTTGYLNNVSYVFPTDLAGNVRKFHEDVFGQAGYNPSATAYSISNEINYRRSNSSQTSSNPVEDEPTTPVLPPDDPVTPPDNGGGNGGGTDPEPHEHSYTETGRQEPTCTEDGYVVYTCSCGESYQEPLPALGHDYQQTGHQDPTETTDGYTEYTCSRCQASYRDVIPATGSSGGGGEGGDGGDGSGGSPSHKDLPGIGGILPDMTLGTKIKRIAVFSSFSAR